MEPVKKYMSYVSHISVKLDTTIIDLIDRINRSSTLIIAVIDDAGIIKGAISTTDIIREMDKDIKSSKLMTGTAQVIMTSNPVSIHQDTLMIDCLDLMTRHRVHSILVFDDDKKPNGIVSHHHVIQWWLKTQLDE